MKDDESEVAVGGGGRYGAGGVEGGFGVTPPSEIRHIRYYLLITHQKSFPEICKYIKGLCTVFAGY